MTPPRRVLAVATFATLAALGMGAPALAATAPEAVPGHVPAELSCAFSLPAGVLLASSADSAMTPGAAPDTAASPPDTSRGRATFPRPDQALLSRLRQGGYVIAFRHAITDWSQRDADLENFESRSAQRNLSKSGEEQSAALGKAIAALGIPVGRILASPMWRCRDTAQLAFGRHETTEDLFRRGGPYREARLLLLSEPIEKGKNLVLVTHQDVLIPIITGLGRDQLKEGEALVIQPLGQRKFHVLAQVSLEDWLRLETLEPSKVGAKSAK